MKILYLIILFVELVGSAPTSCHLAIINCYMLLCTKVQGCLVFCPANPPFYFCLSTKIEKHKHC
nr:MAG TPA: hypothetical protein [Crassvirales sp.]